MRTSDQGKVQTSTIPLSPYAPRRALTNGPASATLRPTAVAHANNNTARCATSRVRTIPHATTPLKPCSFIQLCPRTKVSPHHHPLRAHRLDTSSTHPRPRTPPYSLFQPIDEHIGRRDDTGLHSTGAHPRAQRRALAGDLALAGLSSPRRLAFALANNASAHAVAPRTRAQVSPSLGMQLHAIVRDTRPNAPVAGAGDERRASVPGTSHTRDFQRAFGHHAARCYQVLLHLLFIRIRTP